MQTHLTRRHLLIASASLAAASLPAYAELIPNTSIDANLSSTGDQSATLQSVLDTAAQTGRIVQLPAGEFEVGGVTLPSGVTLRGVPGRTTLATRGGIPALQIAGGAGITLENIVFSGAYASDTLLTLTAATDITIANCRFSAGPTIALRAEASSARISDCDFSDFGDAAIHSIDGLGLLIRGCAIARCGNAGIRIWRSEPGNDGSIITQNHITAIDWRDGGNGQNGNGINVFRAGNVIVSDNHIADCEFTAIRLNASRNAQISGNICLNSGEVAIFSEFGFSGSIIANNIVDGAAGGISMTNLDSDGHLAICTGNIVRNIAPASRTNPDTTPYGIAAEADAVISANTVDSVPGRGISAGYGPFLRNVAITGNVVSNTDIAIAVSVAEGAGRVHIADNLIANARALEVAGFAWTDLVEPDLLANSAAYPNVTVG